MTPVEGESPAIGLAAQPNSDGCVSRGRQNGPKVPLMARICDAVGNRLSVDDRIQAGYVTSAAEGMKALIIDRLRSRPDVTKGRIYWHLAPRPATAPQ
jgi:hypothetical protein